MGNWLNCANNWFSWKLHQKKKELKKTKTTFFRNFFVWFNLDFLKENKKIRIFGRRFYLFTWYKRSAHSAAWFDEDKGNFFWEYKARKFVQNTCKKNQQSTKKQKKNKKLNLTKQKKKKVGFLYFSSARVFKPQNEFCF